MAEEETIRAMAMFWSRDDSDESDGSLVHVPGIQDTGNRRKPRVVDKKQKNIQADQITKPPVMKQVNATQQPPERDKSKKKVKNDKESKMIPKKATQNNSSQAKASLKDLCADDKRRVANLVNELAKLGQERESTQAKLNNDKLDYESKIRDVLEQQEKILIEREAVQMQLMECQRLLAKYQEYMLEQQEKLSDVIADGDAKSKMITSTPDRKNKPRDKYKEDDDVPFIHPNEQELDRKKFSASPRQHTNYRGVGGSGSGCEAWRSSSTKASGSGSRERGATALSGGATSPEEQRTPTGTRKYRVPTSPANRPFTNMIDKLIAQEREARSSAADQYVPDDESNGKKNVHHQSNGKAVAVANGGSCLSKDHLFGIGPLAAPVMSSTQRSDMENGERMTQFPAPSKATSNGTTTDEFQPLQPDTSPHSSLHSANSQPGDFPITDNGNTGYYRGHHSVDMANGVNTGQHESQRGHVTFGATNQIHDHMEDDKFIKMYTKLTPEERKKQLLAQKDALLQEQRRLKAILSEQEALLKAKQEQLHRQQQMQRERLRFFEQTGFFPPVSSAAAANAQGVATTSSAGQGSIPFHQQQQQQELQQLNNLLDTFIPYPSPNVPNNAHPSTSSAINGQMYNNNYNQVTSSSSSSAGYNAYPGQGLMTTHHHPHHHHPQPQHQGGVHPMYPQPHRPYPQMAVQGYDINSAYMVGGGMAMYDGQYASGPPSIHQAPMTAEGLFSDSMENINFLERHGVDVSHMRREHRKGIEVPEMRSAATSPLRPVVGGDRLSQTGTGRYQNGEPHYTILENSRHPHRNAADIPVLELDDDLCFGGKQGNRVFDPGDASRAIQERNTGAMPPSDAAYLLDLVDEVESSHNRSHDMGNHGYMSPHTMTGYHGNQYANGEMAEMEHESRVLEEVFFVK